MSDGTLPALTKGCCTAGSSRDDLANILEAVILTAKEYLDTKSIKHITAAIETVVTGLQGVI